MNYLMKVADEIRREVPAQALPDGETGDLFVIYAVLMLTKGVSVDREDVHNAWTAWMLWRGESHESMVPMDQLPEDVRQEDDVYVKAIRSVATRHER